MTDRLSVDRRSILVGGAGLLTVAGCASAGGAPIKDPLARLGVSSPSFRHLFRRSNPRAVDPIDLVGFPAFVKAQLGLANVEIWSLHFDAQTPEYCEGLRRAAETAGSRIINVQLDDPSLDLSAADDAARQRAIAGVKAWMDRARLCGSPSLRTNVNILPPKTPVSLATVIASCRTLADYGQAIGVKLLIENHVGYTATIDNTIAVVAGADHRWCRAIADWGNSPATDDAQRVADMTRLMPYVDLVSAKGVAFDPANRHIAYDVAKLVQAAEAGGYRGLYSIELYGPTAPQDSVAAARQMIDTVSANLRGA